MPLTLTFELDLWPWPWIFNVKLYIGNGRPDCHGTKGTGFDRMPWYETLRQWINWMMRWLGYLDLWPWICEVKLYLGNGRPDCHVTKGTGVVGCPDVKHNYYFTFRQRILLGTGWLKMSSFPSTRLVCDGNPSVTVNGQLCENQFNDICMNFGRIYPISKYQHKNIIISISAECKYMRQWNE